ncbi:Uncharacterised protein [Staphylococcus gallinarum]|uniref:Uncharacterized protein n=1 Tax=Staphylococcus gallinarum TaxID=1293 RepID=A0A380F972_STAGA|nr:Uncharacterised protein [Staphylococcus gallinarum]
MLLLLSLRMRQLSQKINPMLSKDKVNALVVKDSKMETTKAQS